MEKSSVWGESLDRHAPLQEYPRMHLQRDSYYNLNGTWQYQITERKADPDPSAWKEICVPFALGCTLCGSEETLPVGKALWYRKQFAYQPGVNHTWLHFEAVDTECMVFVNGMEVGTHKGGYTPFSFDISQYVTYQNSLMLRVIDDSEYGAFAYGKQKTEHGGMWYTPTAGIWGTVWLEDVPKHYVSDIKITPDYDNACIHVSLAGSFDQALITIATNGHVVHSGITNDKTYTAPVKDMHPWTLDDPFLYDLYVQTEDDFVRSYFGMRKFSVMLDSKGHPRFAMNNEIMFLTGLLDQGYSIDGSYTYPDEEAIKWEIRQAKQMGFNLLRKHMKVESRRYYYLADRLGILIMQDMPCGGFDHYDKWSMAILPHLGFRKMSDTKKSSFTRMNEQMKKNYMQELEEVMDRLYDFTCICSWVPFNEGWGQFDSRKITAWMKSYDDTRLIDSASGWHDQGCGDFFSLHTYFFRYKQKKDPKGRICLLSEFGGYSYVDNSHNRMKKEYGYRKYNDLSDWNKAIFELYETQILPNIPEGLAGCIYTQIADVEDECNGLMTEDRRVVKIDVDKMRKINEKMKRRGRR